MIFNDVDILVDKRRSSENILQEHRQEMKKEIKRVMIYLWFEVRNEYVRSGIMIVSNDRREVIIWLGCTD